MSLKKSQRLATVIVVSDVVSVCFLKPIFLQKALVELADGDRLQPFWSLNEANHHPDSSVERGHHKSAQQRKKERGICFAITDQHEYPEQQKGGSTKARHDQKETSKNGQENGSEYPSIMSPDETPSADERAKDRCQKKRDQFDVLLCFPINIPAEAKSETRDSSPTNTCRY